VAHTELASVPLTPCGLHCNSAASSAASTSTASAAPHVALYAVAVTSLAIPNRAVMLPLHLLPLEVLRFSNVVRLMRLLGRSYRSDKAGDGPATQVACNGRDGQECRHPNQGRPALVHVKGTNKKN
jgi:hypothetical protein